MNSAPATNNRPATDMTAMRDAVANGSVTAESICAAMMAGARTHNPQLKAARLRVEEARDALALVKRKITRRGISSPGA